MSLPNAQIPLVERGGNIHPVWLLFLNSALSWVKVPSTATSNGIQGQVAYDSTHFYVCVAKNTWVRVALASW